MSRIVIAWETGSGLGHILPHISLIRALQDQGHEIVFVARDVVSASSHLSPLGVACFQAPLRTTPVRNPIQMPCTYAHVLHNIGYDAITPLSAILKGWRNLMAVLRPDLVLIDHGPTALLACRSLGCRSLLLGTGFVIPPVLSPWPNLRTWVEIDPARLAQDEARVLAVINHVLHGLGWKRLHALAQMFEGIPAALCTYPELDPYSARNGGEYFGVFQLDEGEAPIWPDGEGRKVFAYLKSCSTAQRILSALQRRGLPTLVYIRNDDRKLAQRYSSSALRFVSRPLHMTRTSERTYMAILNATHTTTTQMLLAGKPVVNIPIYLEQAITARRLERLGAGITISPASSSPDAAIARILEDPGPAAAAREFASRHRNPAECLAMLVGWIQAHMR